MLWERWSHNYLRSRWGSPSLSRPRIGSRQRTRQRRMVSRSRTPGWRRCLRWCWLCSSLFGSCSCRLPDCSRRLLACRVLKKKFTRKFFLVYKRKNTADGGVFVLRSLEYVWCVSGWLIYIPPSGMGTRSSSVRLTTFRSPLPASSGEGIAEATAEPAASNAVTK